MAGKERHAVVLGGSIAGLLAARALSDRYAEVTLIERDDIAHASALRKGVPQARHAHGLLASGYRALQDLFPGFTRDAARHGAIEIDMGTGVHWCLGGVRLADTRTDLRGLLLSRPELEACIRHRVMGLGNVRVLSGTDALGLLGDARRVRGVRYRARGSASSQHDLGADLVLDATGRGSHLPAWLEQLGLPRPEEARVRMDSVYTTRLYRREPHHLHGKLAATSAALAPNRRSGVAIAQEHDRWIVSLVGYLGERPPLTHEACVEYARGLPAPDIGRLLRDAEPISDPVTGTFPYSYRRRYERLARFPKGLLVIGDALASFNPAYAQGMTVAALQAQLLHRCLEQGHASLATRFLPQASALVDVPWAMALGNDLKFPQVQGPRTALGRVLGAYVDRVQQAGASDPAVARAFLEVAQMCQPPAALFKPVTVGRVLLRGSAWLHDVAQSSRATSALRNTSTPQRDAPVTVAPRASAAAPEAQSQSVKASYLPS